MAIDRFMIAPLNSGLQTNMRPWIIPDDAFAQLNNAYVFRGRVRKRFGSAYMNGSAGQIGSRLRMNLGNTPGPLNLPGNASQLAIGQAFSVGTDIFTVYQLGAGVLTLSTNAGATATINSTTNPNTVTFTGEPGGTAVYYYPAKPVMGFEVYESASLDDEPVFAFDTQFAYQYLSGGWQRLANEVVVGSGASVWSGTNSQFFWAYTYTGLFPSDTYLFVSNFNADDGLRFYSVLPYLGWNKYTPVVDGQFRLITSRIILPFKNRLVCLNTIESEEGVVVAGGNTDPVTGNFVGVVVGPFSLGQVFLVGSSTFTVISTAPGPQPMGFSDIVLTASNNAFPSATFDITTGTFTLTGNGNNVDQPVYWLNNSGSNQSSYVNRCRFSANGTPVRATSGTQFLYPGDAFQQFPGKGGFIDAPIKEQIVTAEFLKDRLIVYFEQSVWELVYTGNNILPFTWQQLNTELGAESTFSVVPFDKIALAVGTVGVHSCNGSNVERIDDKIPDQVFQISNQSDGILRVYGVRDYYVEMVYWTFATQRKSRVYPNKVMVFNYKTGSWAINDDSITAFGYYQGQAGTDWANKVNSWQSVNNSWSSGPLQLNFRQVIGGNQEGYTFIVDADLNTNAAALQITNMTIGANTITFTSIDHNLFTTDYVEIVMPSSSGTSDVAAHYKVYSVPTQDTFVVQFDPSLVTPSGTYKGGGTIRRLSIIDIYTKQYNFYVDKGVNAMINKVDFLVEKTSAGSITVDYQISSSESSQIIDGGPEGTNALVGTGMLDTFPYPLMPNEKTQARLWHPIYPMAEGECIQLHIYLNDEQMFDVDAVSSDFELHAMTFHTSSTSRLQ